ncbi:MAG: phosphoribosyltransferase family protein [Candidatus Bilamarchaeaceae archaeon]
MFRDRFDAGERLAGALSTYKSKKNVLILAIPRGALQIGEVLHRELGAPLDVILTKKIPHPISDEYAIGAVGLEGEYFIDPSAAEGISPQYIEEQRARLSALLEERYRKYHGELKFPSLKGKIVLLVDDGIATGSTMLAAIHMVRKMGAKKIVVAVPVSPPEPLIRIEEEADEVVCLLTTSDFYAIGQFYQDFPQLEDEEAMEILKRCRSRLF